MTRFSILTVSALALVVPAVHAGTITNVISVNKSGPLQVTVTGIMLDCTRPPGTKIMELSAIGGNGNPVTYSLGGTPSGDLAVSGNYIVIGPNGVAPGNCGTVENLTVIATQQ